MAREPALMEHPSRVGKYEVEQFLGGGMSRVYRARDSVLGRRVALKILTDAGVADAEAKARFLLEARTASNINHENIISVYDFGEDQGRPFIVMEFLEGESLRNAIRGGRLGSLERRLKIALQVARALDHIHSRKIVHRDIKPENIHVDAAGKAKLMDFGIAKSEDVKLTRAGFTLGTPYYMAPEQVLGRPLTPQADVYAFGTLLFEMFTGQRVVTATAVDKIFEQILYEPLNLEPLRALPEPLRDLIARCTGKQLVQRPANLAIVCEELERLVAQGQDSASGQGLGRGAFAPVASVAPRPISTPTPISAPPPISMPASKAAGGPAAWNAAQQAPLSQPGLPAFLEILPEGLRSQGGLMFLAAAGAMIVVAMIYIILAMAHVV